MTALSFVAAALVILFIGLFPFGPYQLTLLVARRFGRWSDSDSFPVNQAFGGDVASDTFDVAVCVSAYNEAAVIERKLDNLLAVAGATAANVQIFVYVDGADDGTAEIVNSYSDKATVVVADERRGKTFGLNHLVSLSDCPVVVFTDSTVMLPLNTIDRLLRYLSDPEVGCVTTEISAENRAASATSSVGFAYWRFAGWTKKLESDTGSTVGAFGSLFAVRRSAHDQVPNGLIEDLYVPLDIMCKGFRVVHADDVVAVKPHTTKVGDEFRRKQRIAQQAIDVHRVMWPRLLSGSKWNLYKYLAHRFIRWYGGYFLLVSALLFLAGVLVIVPWPFVVGALAAGIFSVVAGHKFGVPPFAQVANVITAFVGNMIGTWRAFFRPAELTWTVAGSVRSEAHRSSPASEPAKSR